MQVAADPCRPPDELSAGSQRRPKTSIRLQLLVAVNATAAVFVIVFLFFDYRRELAQRLEDKQISLQEEAKTLLPAVLEISHQGPGSVQRYIDAVCGRMQETHSPGHHIAVELKGRTLQASAHHRASPEIFEAMKNAVGTPAHRSRVGRSELVVGAHAKGEATVYVSETLENLKQSVASDVFRRLAGLFVLAILGGVVVNLVLWRVVTRPLHRLVETVQAIGKGKLGTQSQTFRSIELDYLAHEINAMSNSLADADRDRRSQMTKARAIQQNLLPKAITAPGLNVAHVFEPADDVGGDYYDVLPLRDGSCLFVVADVVGHGVPAAMNAAMLKTLLMQAAESFASPAEVLAFINRRFTAVSLTGHFVTMFLARVNPQNSSLDYASAGHEAAWLLSAEGSIRELPSTGLLLGIEEDATWEEEAINVGSGSRLMMVTDGVCETYDAAGNMFGRQRLVDLFKDCRQLTLLRATDRLSDELSNFRNGTPQLDDVTAVLIEWTDDRSRNNVAE